MSYRPAKKSLAVWVLSVFAVGAWAGEVTVSAAASLTNAFKDIAQSYEAQHPGTKVLLNLGASGALLQQMARARQSTCLPPPTKKPWTRRKKKA